MLFALLALVVAAVVAGWLLFGVAGKDGTRAGKRPTTLLKFVALLVLSAVLFAAKLWPLAFMVLLAVGGVSAIEAWRERASPADKDDAPAPQPLPRRMSAEEARSILGVTSGASADEVRVAHRKLISQLHPDKGGTDYLAAKINEARDFLLHSLGE
jgi:hypothetical protein